MSRDFSELDLQLVMYDFNDTEDEREDNVVAGVAIRAEDAEAFAADVEKLAVEKYGGATFAGLLDAVCLPLRDTFLSYLMSLMKLSN